MCFVSRQMTNAAVLLVRTVSDIHELYVTAGTKVLSLPATFGGVERNSFLLF